MIKFLDNTMHPLPAILILTLFSACTTLSGHNQTSPLEANIAVSPLGHLLQTKSLKQAALAETDALERTPTGQSANWEANGLARGRITPGQPFEVSGRICRRYTHQISANGQEAVREATACKDQDNIWQPV